MARDGPLAIAAAMTEPDCLSIVAFNDRLLLRPVHP